MSHTPLGFGSGATTAAASPTASTWNLSLTPEPDGSEALPESRVLIIMTGGTICMVRSDNGYVPAKGFLNSCLKPRPSFNDGSPAVEVHSRSVDGKDCMLPTLRTPPSKHSRRIRFAALEFEPLLDSSSINAKGWAKIAKCIEVNYQLFDSFVILHGTDSLAYTSSALSFMISNLGKPIVLTGSQAPMSELHNDATDNLLGSLIVAGHFMIPEVCLFFHHKLFRGNRSTKTNAHDFAAFASPNHPPLAKVGISTVVNWNYVLRPETLEPFSIQTNLDTSHVACLRLFPGIMPEMIRGVCALKGLKGLVLETFGAGNAPEDAELMAVLKEAVRGGLVIVNVTQCQVGRVSPLYYPATVLASFGIVFGWDLTTEAALTKLSVLLANPSYTTSDVRRLMSASLRGELTEEAGEQFHHPNLPIAPHAAALAELATAIKEEDVEKVDYTVRESRLFLLNQFDAGGNTPLHLAALSPSLMILRDFLRQGASVHLRNHAGHTPLFLAAEAGRLENVRLLIESGAHLHEEEKEEARGLRDAKGGCWEEEGVLRSWGIGV